MSTPSPDLLILGGGIAAKACALALAHTGLNLTLLGARAVAQPLPPERYTQRLYALNAASRQLLDQLRVWPHIPPERIQPVQAMHIRADGAQLTFQAQDARAEALAWMVESDAIEAAIDLALRFERRVQIDPVQAERLHHHPSSGWQVQTSDGRTLQTALLIGADGEHSLVRKASGIPMDVHDYMQRGVVANFVCAAPHDGVAFQTFADGGVIALLPLAPMRSQPMVSLVWSAPEPLAQALLALPPDELARQVDAHLPALRAQHLGPLQATGSAAAWRLQRQLARRSVANDLVLIGDAAHRVHPLAGQGLNLGLQDVQVLAHILQQRPAGQAINDPRLLRRYSRARAEQVLALATATDSLARLYAAQSRIPAPLRAVGLHAANALPPLKQLLTRYASGLPYLA
jgi:ubiquinone biosynthesis UbiH/UbiF/VisC/COQ6 family hydroxylase